MKKIRGFTLVEMLVAITLFSVVTLIATGSVLKVSDAYRKAQALENVINNLNFVMETITRDVRVSTAYYCANVATVAGWNAVWSQYPSTTGRNCFQGINPASGNALAYMQPGATTPVGYMLLVDATSGIGSIMACTSAGSTVCSRLTSPYVDVESLTFFVDGTGFDDNKQPALVMSLSGKVALGKQGSSPFTVQTTMVQRVLDY